MKFRAAILLGCLLWTAAALAGQDIQPAFTPLKFGDIKPRGWILEQMRRDLQTGFAGHLDELCREASSDIFASGRNRPGKANSGNAAGDAWWNGETEGNWHCGHFMLACLTGEPAAMKKAKDYVEHILAAQDADGYIGVFSPELRYRGNGELWTQTCLFRGLLAYGEATGNERVYAAVKLAVDRTIAGYAGCQHIAFAQHDVMYTDVLEFLHAKTGDRKYLEFGLRLYRESPNMQKYRQPPEADGLFQNCFVGGHGATVTEVMRLPLWLWQATGDEQYGKKGVGVVAAMNHWIMPDGALVSDESVSAPPRPWGVGYEYCTIFEREFTLITAGQKTGDADDFEGVEHLWFNAAQGSREPDGSAILYCSHENRLSVHDEMGARQRFSPTHQQVAVCCCPNSTRVAPYFISNAWMKPAGSEPVIAATLYGPCEVKTEIAGMPVRIEEETLYPYAGDVEIALHPEKPTTFCLWLRNPSWSSNTRVVCRGAETRLVNGFWQVRKKWKAGDRVTIHFDQTIREVPAINGEVALQYGPLLYVLPVEGKPQTIKTYAKSDLKDYYVSPAAGTDAKLGLPPDKRDKAFGFVPKTVKGTNSEFPLDNPPVVLEGALLNTAGVAVPVTLVPMGAKNAQLRRVTFRVGVAPPMMTGGFEAEKAKLLGGANLYADPAASGGFGVGYIGREGDGIECRSPLLTGQRLKIRYATPTAATLTLQVNNVSQKVSFPATGDWKGDGNYDEITVTVAIPENAVVQLWRGPDDGAVNLDCLKGERPTNAPIARFVNNRVDNDLVAGMGTCQVDDFRFFTMLHQDSWDLLRWETLGNAVMEHRTWRNWPYEQRLRVQVDGEDISAAAKVDQVEQQFDFRQVAVSSPAVKIERLDMMLSARQWTTALHLTNLKSTPVKVVVEVEWTGKNKVPLDVRPWSDADSKGFAYALKNGPPILVTIGANETWEKQGDASVRNRWEVELKPGAAVTLDMNAHIGWAAMPAYRDSGPGIPATDEQATIDRRADSEGFRRVMAALGVSAVGNQWTDLQKICDAKRHYVYDRMPRLQGFDPEWDGMWSYAFDLMHSAIYPAQGNFKDVWKVESLDVYREPFYWDCPAMMHSFCNWDADLSARMMRTFWSSMQPDGTVCVSANPYRAYNNPTPQLANLTMALWDCYQITHDKEMLASFYPEIVKHVRWLETKRNRTPNGPLMDVGYNIDYGPPSLYSSPTIWPDVQFFLVDRYRRLAKISAVLGKPQTEVDEWSGKADRLADGIRKHMWDDKAGTFWCVSDKLQFKPVPSPIEFHGMVADVPTREQARRLLERLNDPAKYAPTEKHPYGLPSAPFDSPLFVVKDSWSGTIWPIQTYYTVRGLVNYGYQEEAAALSTNLYGMMARDYRQTGSIWEQYDPISGKDLSNPASAKTCNESGRGYFTSGITTSVLDMLLRGLFGFERTDDANAFYLTPTPIKKDWHGIENLPLSGNIRLSIQMKKSGTDTVCKVRFTGQPKEYRYVEVQRVNQETGAKEIVKRAKLDARGEVEVVLNKTGGARYLWKLK